MAPKVTGMPAIVKVAAEMCRLITKFRHVILIVTDNDPAVTAALLAAETACVELRNKLDEYIPQGV